MMILTRYGYKDINDINIGEEVIAYDINDGHIIYNILEGKELWTLDRYQDEYGPDTQICHESGSIVYNESGSIMYDCLGNIMYESGSIIYNESGSIVYDCLGNIVYDEEGNIVYHQSNSIQLDCDGNPVYEKIILYHQSSSIKLDCDGNSIYDGIPYYETIPGELIKTKEQIFEEQHGPFTFYRINDTWDLYKDQSIWANLNVIHVSELQIGDIVYDDDDNDVEITSIQEITGSQWWRLTISGDHSYIADNITLHNASRFWAGGGSSTAWNATGNTNWASTSGGANNASVPTSTDDAIFDGQGTNGNTDNNISAATTVLSLYISSSYTAAMSHSAALTVAGPIRLGENYLISGSVVSTNNLKFTGLNAALTSSNRTLPIGFEFAPASQTIQRISGSLTLQGSLTASTAQCEVRPATDAITDTIYCGGFASVINASSNAYIHTRIVVTTGSITKPASTSFGLNAFIGGLIIAPTGSVTIGVLGVYGGSGSAANIRSIIRFITGSGTINTGSIVINGLQIAAGQGVELDTLNIPFQNFDTVTNTTRLYLSSSLPINGVATIGSNTTVDYASMNPSASLIARGGLRTTNALLGTAKVVLISGSWTGTAALQNNTDISGSITIGDAQYGGTAANVLRYISGSVTITGGTTLTIPGSCTLDVEPIRWNNITFSTATTTIILSSSFYATGSTGFNNGAMPVYFNVASSNPTASWYTNGLVVRSGTAGGTTLTRGTAKIVVTGGSLGTTGASLYLGHDMDLSGSIQVSGTLRWIGSATTTWITGSVSTLGSTCLFEGGGNTFVFDTPQVIWDTYTIGNSVQIHRFNSTLLTRTLALSLYPVTFTGSAGFITNTLTAGGGGSAHTITLGAGNTYYITSSFTSNGNRIGANTVFTSNDAVTRSILTLAPGATCNTNANFTRIDASQGRPINTWNGTVTNCVNVNSWYDKGVVGSSS